MAAPEQRFVPRFAAEPPQEELPYGRWAERLAGELLGAARELDTDGEDIGDVKAVVWYPDRTWHGWTYVPATAPTANGYELFGFVRFQRGAEGGEPGAFSAQLDYTQETAERNPGWELDICEEVVGAWRGENGAEAAMTLVWGRPLVPGGATATAELADLVVDQTPVVEERFTLLAPDDYRGDLLEIGLFDARGHELARESLYTGDDEDAGDEPEE
ncbi:MAG TPA: hypothetical protein VHT27_14635 [Solirubrobacteraceae bacterium]|jgi:hypothetical protein|nr:hypothetical protein [Solirubrobacteraceae bacterium]